MKIKLHNKRKEKKDKMGKIFFDENKCVHCDSCILACSFQHTGEYNPLYARIKEIKEKDGSYVLNVCKQCIEQTCYNVCPNEAIYIDKEKSILCVDEEKCTGCGICVKKCNYNGIFLHFVDKKAIKCDLCIDNPPPICVEVCIPKALIYQD